MFNSLARAFFLAGRPLLRLCANIYKGLLGKVAGLAAKSKAGAQPPPQAGHPTGTRDI